MKRIRHYPATPENTKRKNWLIIHEGHTTLFADQINDALEMSLVKECHSMAQDGLVHTLVHLCAQKRAVTLGDIAIVLGLQGCQVHSFTSSKAAFAQPVIRTMVRGFQEKDGTVVSTWKRNVKPYTGFFFNALLTKHNAPEAAARQGKKTRRELLARIEELERERDEYKKRLEEMAAAVAEKMLNE